jgi:hypothetical protein
MSNVLSFDDAEVHCAPCCHNQCSLPSSAQSAITLTPSQLCAALRTQIDTQCHTSWSQTWTQSLRTLAAVASALGAFYVRYVSP